VDGFGGIVCDQFEVAQTVAEADVGERSFRFDFEQFIEAEVSSATVALRTIEIVPHEPHKVNGHKQIPAVRLESRPERRDEPSGRFWVQTRN
jgi:hypothetical protein